MRLKLQELQRNTKGFNKNKYWFQQVQHFFDISEGRKHSDNTKDRSADRRKMEVS